MLNGVIVASGRFEQLYPLLGWAGWVPSVAVGWLLARRWLGPAARGAGGAAAAARRRGGGARDRPAAAAAPPTPTGRPSPTGCGAAHDEGRLGFAEYDDRLARAYAAVTYADLDDLVADLPGRRGSPPARRPAASGPAVPAGRRAVPGVARRCSGPCGRASFGINLVVWVLVSLGNGRPDTFWPMWLLVPATVLLVVTAGGPGRCGGADREAPGGGRAVAACTARTPARKDRMTAVAPCPDRPPRRRLVLGLMLTMALAAMDTTIVATAVPQIVGSIGGFSIFSWLFSSTCSPRPSPSRSTGSWPTSAAASRCCCSASWSSSPARRLCRARGAWSR